MALTEIEKEAENLPAAKRAELLLFLAESFGKEQAQLPKPRLFSDDQLQAWMEEDKRTPRRWCETARCEAST